MLSISLRPNGRRAVIVGGGNVAARKADVLLNAGFSLFVVAERLDDGVRSLLGEGRAICEARRYETPDLEGALVVVAATDDSELNARVVDDARRAGALACDATNPQRGDFTMPAVRRLGELTIAVDSGGDAPAFSRRVVREIAESLGEPYAAAVRALAAMRKYVKATFPEHERGPILRRLAQRPIGELVAMPIEAVCATRRSVLAMIQSRWVAARLATCGIATAMLGVTTAGDRDRQKPIDELGVVNVFIEELESALRERRADYAVHSCKDLPSSLAGDMRIAAISPREDARDVFCSERYASFASLPPGARVGTSSPRRRVQLAALRPDLRYEPLRGNVDTRLRKLAAGEYDAIVLALAGLNRLGAAAKHMEPFTTDQLVPAAGQGALAVETRADDDRLFEVLRAAINDPRAELCVACERAALRTMRAGCSAPIGVHAGFESGTMIARGVRAFDDGTVSRSRLSGAVSTVKEAEELGTELAARLSARTPSASGVAS
jgi:hydroxymethylbilane synthase